VFAFGGVVGSWHVRSRLKLTVTIDEKDGQSRKLWSADQQTKTKALAIGKLLLCSREQRRSQVPDWNIVSCVAK